MYAVPSEAQEREPDSPRPELQTVMSYPVGAGN